MGDMADYVNEVGFEQACYEQDIIDRGDQREMFEAGLIDNMGAMDLRNPPGLIGFARPELKTIGADNKCPNCGAPVIKRTNSHTKQKFWGCSKFPACRFSQ